LQLLLDKCRWQLLVIMIGIELKHESKDLLLVRVWHRDRVISLIALHARSQLFMVTLTSKSCLALVAQALLVKLLCPEMPEYCVCYGKFVWPNGDTPEGWEVNWESKL
jgi:hypothetical protein